MTKGGESQPRILRAPAISSSPGASLCAFCVPALVGKPKPMIVRQAIMRGLVRHRAGGDDGLADRVRVVAVDL